MQYDYRYR